VHAAGHNPFCDAANPGGTSPPISSCGSIESGPFLEQCRPNRHTHPPT
jgi:hypothetical protein